MTGCLKKETTTNTRPSLVCTQTASVPDPTAKIQSCSISGMRPTSTPQLMISQTFGDTEKYLTIKHILKALCAWVSRGFI
jgi:hypothetical protein